MLPACVAKNASRKRTSLIYSDNYTLRGRNCSLVAWDHCPERAGRDNGPHPTNWFFLTDPADNDRHPSAL